MRLRPGDLNDNCFINFWIRVGAGSPNFDILTLSRILGLRQLSIVGDPSNYKINVDSAYGKTSTSFTVSYITAAYDKWLIYGVELQRDLGGFLVGKVLYGNTLQNSFVSTGITAELIKTEDPNIRIGESNVDLRLSNLMIFSEIGTTQLEIFNAFKNINMFTPTSQLNLLSYY
jgi:hypothetical protein